MKNSLETVSRRSMYPRELGRESSLLSCMCSLFRQLSKDIFGLRVVSLFWETSNTLSYAKWNVESGNLLRKLPLSFRVCSKAIDLKASSGMSYSLLLSMQRTCKDRWWCISSSVGIVLITLLLKSIFWRQLARLSFSASCLLVSSWRVQISYEVTLGIISVRVNWLSLIMFSSMVALDLPKWLIDEFLRMPGCISPFPEFASLIAILFECFEASVIDSRVTVTNGLYCDPLWGLADTRLTFRSLALMKPW